MELQEALNELRFLPPNLVADHLRQAGIKGKRQSAHQCPVARFLSEKTGQEVSVCAFDLGNTNYFYATPPAVAEFIRLFDAGNFPDLEEKE